MSEIVKSIKIHSVAACCRNNGIGKNGDLAWKLKKEFSHFTNLTSGKNVLIPEGKKNAVVMGRKTWESIPAKFRPLPNRYNFVLTRNTSISCLDGANGVVHSVQELVDLLTCNEWKDKIHEVYNVGGSQIYKLIQDSEYCGNIFLTRIDSDFDCDTFFPDISQDFCQIPSNKFSHIPQKAVEEKGVKWVVEVYQKIKTDQ